MRNDTKRKFGTMFLAAAIVFFGHWWDFFYMIKPGARIAAYEAALHGGAHSSSLKPEAAPFEMTKLEEKLPTALAGVQEGTKPAEAAPQQQTEHPAEAPKSEAAIRN